MNHPYGSSMFLDLDKPLLKDPLERIEAAMEWEAISEMYAQRDEHRKRTGFVRDLHEERGFSLNPITGRYRDAPGFNPPRRVEKRDYEGIPIEVKGIILDNIEGFRNRTLTRTVSRSHAQLTRSLDDIIDEVIEGVLKDIPRPSLYGRDIHNGKKNRRTFKVWATSILYTVSKRMLEKLSIPLEVEMVPLKQTRFRIKHEENLSPDLPIRLYENEFLFLWHMEYGTTTTLGIFYHQDHDDEDYNASVYATNLWDHYRVIMKIIGKASRSIEGIFMDTERVEEEYKIFKEKRSSGGS